MYNATNLGHVYGTTDTLYCGSCSKNFKDGCDGAKHNGPCPSCHPASHTKGTPMTASITYGYLDFETTGLLPWKHAPIEFTLGLFNEKMEPIATFESGQIAIEDGDEVTDKALECNGYNAEDLRNGKSRVEVLSELIHFVGNRTSSPIILIGHNVGFDYGFMQKMFRFEEQLMGRYFSHRKIDVQGLCHIRNLLNGTMHHSTSLASMRREFGITSVGAHTSKADVEHGMQVFLKLMQEMFHWPSPTIDSLRAEGRTAILQNLPDGSPPTIA